MKAPVVALLTDYGSMDTYVAELKGMLLRYRTDVNIVDICHEITPYNILEGAFLLKLAARTFPDETIFIAVVDPTVGGRRDGVSVFTKSKKVFVGPDNGLLYPAAEAEGIISVYRIKAEKIPKVSPTFHGRDVFAYFVGHLISGKKYAELLEPKENLIRYVIPEPVIERDFIEALVLHVDRFGNVITNIKGRLPEDWEAANIMVRNTPIGTVRLARTYSEAEVGEPLLVVGGTGYTELAVNQGNASRKYSISPGDIIKIFRNQW